MVELYGLRKMKEKRTEFYSEARHSPIHFCRFVTSPGFVV